jgi:hypothetical protein
MTTTPTTPSGLDTQARTTPALADAWDATAKTSASLLEDLLVTNRDEILNCWAESGLAAYSLSVNLTLKGAANAPLITLKLSWVAKHSDEASEQIKDPNQPEFGFDDHEQEEPDGTRSESAQSPLRLQAPEIIEVTMEPLALPGPGEGQTSSEPEPKTNDDPVDPEIFDLAAQLTFQEGATLSIAAIQRQLKIGFTKAARVHAFLLKKGLIVVNSDTDQRDAA